MKILTKIIVTLFYTGYFKFIPGTFASIISLIIVFPLVKFNILSYYIFIALFIILLIISYFFIRRFSTDTKTHDSKRIVIDEFLGIYFILIFYDQIFFFNDLITLLLIFIFFRFFDILKIFPANLIDKKMINPIGVILDDLVASIYTIILLFTFNVIY